MKIVAEITLNRRLGDDNDEFQQRMDDVAAELAGGTGPWHRRFDRLRDPDDDGADQTTHKGQLTQFVRWAVVTDPAPALANFFADTDIVPTYDLSTVDEAAAQEPSPSQTATLTFRPARQSPATGEELRLNRLDLLDTANDIIRFQETVAEMWTYLEQNPDKRRAWVSFLIFLDDGDNNEFETNLSKDEEELWERLFDNLFLVLWPDDDLPEGQTFTLHERLQQAFDAFPAAVTVIPDGEVIEAVGFIKSEDGYAVSTDAIEEAAVSVLDQVVSPNFVRYWDDIDGWQALLGHAKGDESPVTECDRDCQLDAILAQPFFVGQADQRQIAQALEEALTPLGDYRLRWIRSP